MTQRMYLTGGIPNALRCAVDNFTIIHCVVPQWSIDVSISISVDALLAAPGWPFSLSNAIHDDSYMAVVPSPVRFNVLELIF